MKQINPCLAGAVQAFPYSGQIARLEPFGSGHINETYAVYMEGEPDGHISYVLQRLNTHVFKKPKEVMENIMGVTEYLHDALEHEGRDVNRGVLNFLKTHDGQHAYYDEQGMPWRSYLFVKNSFCYEQSPTEEIFYESARAFGDFLRMLQNYPAETLHETIPYFHDTRRRMEALKAAVAADVMGRAAACQEEIAFALAREKDCALLMDLLEKGRLPLRVTHNDTKLNNVLFDQNTNDAICIIDLDTIMPGLSLNDFGDSIRFGATTAAEDEQDLSKVTLSLPLYEAYTKGYLETAGQALTPLEKELLPQGARVITLECGIRFLTDHLEGDTYFKIDKENHNLHRCRTQFKLVQEMEQNMPELQRIVAAHS